MMTIQSNSSIQIVEEAVTRFYPGLLPAVKCGLSVVCSMALKGRTKPLSIMFETTSGYGKSAVVQMFFPLDKGTVADPFIYRCDKFTPKSFVSHAANVTSAKLKGVDLLPKLQNKTLVTKEMSPLFRGREEEMRENFSTLIAVLDGKGFVSDSGVKGHRGYEQNIIFNWLGATTPLPRETHRLMYQLGTRLLFYETPSIEPTEEALLAYAERDDTSQAETECQEAVNRFLVDFFTRHQIGSIPPGSVQFPRDVLRDLTQWALFVASGRREIRYEKNNANVWSPVSAAKPEGPWKIVNYFKELARAHALIHGRTEVIPGDLELVSAVAVSSIPIHLRPIIRRLTQHGSITSTECAHLLDVAKPTAIRYLTELKLSRIGSLAKGSETENRPDTLTPADKFSWLTSAPLTTSGGCVMECEEKEGLEERRTSL